MEKQDKIIYDNLENEKAKIRRIENEIHSKPKNSDLKNTVSLLRDFGIKIEISDIPDCKSLFELERWRLRIITKKLGKGE